VGSLHGSRYYFSQWGLRADNRQYHVVITEAISPRQQREFSTLSEFKIWVRHECEHDDAPYTFPITVEAPTPAAEMEQAKGTLAHAYMMSHAQGVADCPAMMTWWLDGHEAEADRALMVAQRVGA
jgi:hypothetical protein